MSALFIFCSILTGGAHPLSILFYLFMFTHPILPHALAQYFCIIKKVAGKKIGIKPLKEIYSFQKYALKNFFKGSFTL